MLAYGWLLGCVFPCVGRRYTCYFHQCISRLDLRGIIFRSKFHSNLCKYFVPLVSAGLATFLEMLSGVPHIDLVDPFTLRRYVFKPPVGLDYYQTLLFQITRCGMTAVVHVLIFVQVMVIAGN